MVESIRKSLKKIISSFKKSPKLVAIQLGDEPSVCFYVKNQKKQAEAVGIDYEVRKLKSSVSQKQVINLIRKINTEKTVTGTILQLPLPKHLDARSIISELDPIKDAEGIHPVNLGKVLLGNYTIGPCTALAVMEILRYHKVDLYGKEVVLVGHSSIVGKPLALMLLNEYATTTVCHIATHKRRLIPDHVKRAEVLVVAVGKPEVVKGAWIKKGAIVIDVGINKRGDTIVGDVEFERAKGPAKMITPVPGGVGPLTTCMLMRNVVELYKLQNCKMR